MVIFVDKLIPGTDSATLEKTHVLNLKDTCAMSMDYYNDTENPDSEISRLVYGTDSGYVYVYDFPNKLFADRGPRKKDSHVEINMEILHTKSAKYFGLLQKRKAHADWTVKVRYYHSIKAIVSCSPDSVNSLVLATEDSNGRWSTVTASVQKGISCFAYCTLPVALVTGSAGKSFSKNSKLINK